METIKTEAIPTNFQAQSEAEAMTNLLAFWPAARAQMAWLVQAEKENRRFSLPTMAQTKAFAELRAAIIEKGKELIARIKQPTISPAIQTQLNRWSLLLNDGMLPPPPAGVS